MMDTADCIFMASRVPDEDNLTSQIERDKDPRLNAQIIRALCAAVRDLAGIPHILDIK